MTDYTAARYQHDKTFLNWADTLIRNGPDINDKASFVNYVEDIDVKKALLAEMYPTWHIVHTAPPTQLLNIFRNQYLQARKDIGQFSPVFDTIDTLAQAEREAPGMVGGLVQRLESARNHLDKKALQRVRKPLAQVLQKYAVQQSLFTFTSYDGEQDGPAMVRPK